MQWDQIDAVPLTTAVIVLVAVAALTGLTLAFSGSIHF